MGCIPRPGDPQGSSVHSVLSPSWEPKCHPRVEAILKTSPFSDRCGIPRESQREGLFTQDWGHTVNELGSSATKFDTITSHEVATPRQASSGCTCASPAPQISLLTGGSGPPFPVMSPGCLCAALAWGQAGQGKGLLVIWKPPEGGALMGGVPDGGASGKSDLLAHQLSLTVSRSMWQFAWLRPDVLKAAGEAHGRTRSGISWEAVRSREGGPGRMTAVGYKAQRGLGNGRPSPSRCHFTVKELRLREGKQCWHSHSVSSGQGWTGRRTPIPSSGHGVAILQQLRAQQRVRWRSPVFFLICPFKGSMSPPLQSGLLGQMECGR